jgi:hypothetical protein
MDLQAMYCVGGLIAGFVSIAAFIWGFRLMEKQEDAKWHKQSRQQIETIGRQTQSVSG